MQTNTLVVVVIVIVVHIQPCSIFSIFGDSLLVFSRMLPQYWRQNGCLNISARTRTLCDEAAVSAKSCTPRRPQFGVAKSRELAPVARSRDKPTLPTAPCARNSACRQSARLFRRIGSGTRLPFFGPRRGKKRGQPAEKRHCLPGCRPHTARAAVAAAAAAAGGGGRRLNKHRVSGFILCVLYEAAVNALLLILPLHSSVDCVSVRFPHVFIAADSGGDFSSSMAADWQWRICSQLGHFHFSVVFRSRSGTGTICLGLRII